MGNSRPSVANTLRLLNMPPAIHGLIMDGPLAAADARALLQRALDPTVQAATTSGPRPASDSLSGFADDEGGVNDLPAEVVCWPDYAIGSPRR